MFFLQDNLWYNFTKPKTKAILANKLNLQNEIGLNKVIDFKKKSYLLA